MHVLEKLMPLPPQIPQLVTLGEAANRLAVSKRHLQRLVARGELPTVRVGECVRISTAVLVAFIASKTRIG
jgi:excisionase family DNA binding protein